MMKKFVWLIFILMALLMAGCWGSDDNSSSAKNNDGYNDQYDYTNGTLDFPALNNFGIVALNNTGSICILDGNALKISEPLLNHEFGSYGGGLFDVAITPDGKTAMVSNFGDSTVYFIDTSNPSMPHVKGSVQIDFFAEDIAVTPNGKYLLVTNGGFASRIAVVDIEGQKVVKSDVPKDSLYHNAVSVSPDGRTVLTADYFACRVNVFTLSSYGNLTYRKTIDLFDDIESPRPVNLEISPDGKTVIVASANAPLVFPILTIQGPGDVVLSDIVKQNAGLRGAQSVAFNRAGTKAYLHCVTRFPDANNVSYDGNAIAELQKNFMGKWEVSQIIPVDFYGTSQLFGVDTLAINDTNGYLYVSNPTVSGGTPYVQVVDVNQGKVIKTLKTEDAEDDFYPPSDPDFMSIPTGITFWNKR